MVSSLSASTRVFESDNPPTTRTSPLGRRDASGVGSSKVTLGMDLSGGVGRVVSSVVSSVDFKSCNWLSVAGVVVGSCGKGGSCSSSS